MRYLKLKILFFLLLIFINTKTLANEKVVYVDMEIIMNNSIVGKLISEELNKNHKLNIEFFKKTEQELIKKEKKLVSQQNILDKAELEKQLKSLQLEANEYRKEKNQRIKNINEKKMNATKLLLKNITPILSEYAKNNSISVILQKKDIVIGKTELDKTNDILKLVDKKIKKIDFN